MRLFVQKQTGSGDGLWEVTNGHTVELELWRKSDITAAVHW